MLLWSGSNAPRWEEKALRKFLILPPAGFRVHRRKDSNRTNNVLMMEPHQTSSACKVLKLERNEATVSSV